VLEELCWSWLWLRAASLDNSVGSAWTDQRLPVTHDVQDAATIAASEEVLFIDHVKRRKVTAAASKCGVGGKANEATPGKLTHTSDAGTSFTFFQLSLLFSLRDLSASSTTGIPSVDDLRPDVPGPGFRAVVMPPYTDFAVQDSYQYLDGLGNYHQCVPLGDGEKN
jgi:hypothetical protein